MKQKVFVQRIASHVAGWFGVRYYHLYYGEMSLAGEIQPVESPIELHIRRATQQDLVTIVERMGEGTRNAVERAERIGSVCYVAEHDDRLAGYSWVNHRIIDLVGMEVSRLPEGGAFSHSSYVLPKYRGKKVFQSLIYAVYQELKVTGYAYAASLVDTANAPSIAARRRFGVLFQPVRILKLPGLAPIQVGRRLVMGLSMRDKPVSRST